MIKDDDGDIHRRYSVFLRLVLLILTGKTTTFNEITHIHTIAFN